MSDHAILFSPVMVRSILAGNKTATRRLAWGAENMFREVDETTTHKPSAWQKVRPGDRLWVREKWRVGRGYDGVKPRDLPPPFPSGTGINLWYEADQNPLVPRGGRIRPAMFMPRWASRLTLGVTAVRIELLHDMKEADAIAEGVEYETADPGFWYVPGIWPHSLTAVGIEEPGASAVRSYAKLWAHLHGPQSWAENPTVVVITFRRLGGNIDTLKEAA